MDNGPPIVGRPTGQPVIPPLEATTPTDSVAAGSNESVRARQVNYGSGARFSPLRSDPPPSLVSTWWLRTAILLLMLGALVLTVWVEYTGEADDIASNLLVIGLHIVIAGSIVLWSFAAMHNANKLVPPSLYQRRSNPLLAAVLWLGALSAPFAAVKAFTLVDERSAASAGPVAEPSTEAATMLALAAMVLVAFVVVWLPFRYHARQALRIGAPRGAMLGWFFAPLLALVGGIAILSLGLHDQLALDGLTAPERTIQVVVAYGLPMLMFTLTTWRALTVFDEVIDMKWRRWKVEWEQTLEDLVRQPAPGPEGSPDTRLLRN
ncbi:MAG: hypothetical protein ACI9N0_000926 [Ilumatobacter sp.]|jgi:hypothetical protein